MRFQQFNIRETVDYSFMHSRNAVGVSEFQEHIRLRAAQRLGEYALREGKIHSSRNASIARGTVEFDFSCVVLTPKDAHDIEDSLDRLSRDVVYLASDNNNLRDEVASLKATVTALRENANVAVRILKSGDKP